VLLPVVSRRWWRVSSSFFIMSCGCGCCSKCGCQATCTCNNSMWFDETMGDDSYASLETLAGAIDESGANCGFAPGSCPVNVGFSDCYSSMSSAGGACGEGGDQFGDPAFE